MPKEDIGPITKEEIQLALTRLRAVLPYVLSLSEWFEQHPEANELWVWRFKSLNRGLEALEGMPKEFTRSIHAYATGKPLGPNSSKARGAAKELLEHSKEVLKSHQQAAKATKKKPKTKE